MVRYVLLLRTTVFSFAIIIVLFYYMFTVIALVGATKRSWFVEELCTFENPINSIFPYALT